MFMLCSEVNSASETNAAALKIRLEAPPGEGGNGIGDEELREGANSAFRVGLQITGGEELDQSTNLAVIE